MARSHGPGELLERARTTSTGVDDTVRRMRRAALLHLDGDVDEASRIYRAVLAEHPDHSVAHNNLGFLLAQAGQLEEAVVHYEAALEADPGSSMALTNLGNARISQGYQSGLQFLENAVEAAPENPVAWESLGRARLLFEDLAGAEEALRSALDIPDAGEASLVTLGAVVAAQGRLGEAIAILEAAVRRNPRAAGAWEQLGMVRLARKDLGAAEEALRTAVRLDPQRFEARRQLATSLLALGETERAANELRQILDATDSPDVVVDLAIVELASGNTESARTRLLDASQRADDDRVLFHLGPAELAGGNAEEASRLFRQLIGTESRFATKAQEYLEAIDGLAR